MAVTRRQCLLALLSGVAGCHSCGVTHVLSSRVLLKRAMASLGHSDVGCSYPLPFRDGSDLLVGVFEFFVGLDPKRGTSMGPICGIYLMDPETGEQVHNRNIERRIDPLRRIDNGQRRSRLSRADVEGNREQFFQSLDVLIPEFFKGSRHPSLGRSARMYKSALDATAGDEMKQRYRDVDPEFFAWLDQLAS